MKTCHLLVFWLIALLCSGSLLSMFCYGLVYVWLIFVIFGSCSCCVYHLLSHLFVMLLLLLCSSCLLTVSLLISLRFVVFVDCVMFYFIFVDVLQCFSSLVVDVLLFCNSLFVDFRLGDTRYNQVCWATESCTR